MRTPLRDKALAKSRFRQTNLVCQLSRTELHAATTAFFRARGHFHGLSIDCFRDTLLHEVFVTIPEFLVQRLFREWNVSGSGEISCAEFSAGVATAIKGSREDHLALVFRMLSPSGDTKNISRSDLFQCFECVATNSGCVAVEQGKITRSWTTDQLLQILIESSQTGVLTLETFLTFFGSSSSFVALHFIDWIPNLAGKILKANAAVAPMHTIPRSTTDSLHFTTQRGLSSKQRDDVRSELRSILSDVSANSSTLTPGSVIDRCRSVLADDTLVNTIENAWGRNVAFSAPAKGIEAFFVDAVCDELKLFVLGLCCVEASSVDQVYRILFELFDEYNCGQIGVDQLSVFLQMTTGRSPIDSEREAAITIRRRGRAPSSLSSPPPSPGGKPIEKTAGPQVLTLTQFIKVAQEQSGFSAAEVETALLLFHLKRCRLDYQGNALFLHFLDNYSLNQNTQSNAFCLMNSNEWERITEEMLKWQQKSSHHTNAQILCEEATQLPSGHVIMPLSIWILASFQYGMTQESYRYAANLSSNIQLHDNQQNLNGFWLRISVTITSRDGFERAAVFPQVIAFEHCTFQSVIDAILFQKNWCGYGNDTSSNVITMCQCQALIAERNAAGEIKTVVMQDEPKTLQQDQLATSLGSILPFNCASEALQSIIDHRKIAFELLFSVVEVEESTEGGGTQSRNEESLVPVVDVGKVIEPLVYQQMPRTIAKIPRGLTNLGNTCFMNAVLQCLAVTPMLNTQICQKEIHSEQLSSPTPREKPIQPFSETLGELFAEMSRSKQDTNTTISPKNLLKAFSVLSPDMADGNQQDAQEFLVCLLDHLSNRLTREPKTSDESLILSPRSHAWLSNLFQRNDNGAHGKIAVPFCAEDSNGRHDRLVATEWWVSHLVSEPSLVNILFSGQFKSVLVCDHCAHQSARFEPFSSLQLPLEEKNTAELTTENDQQDLVVIVHFAESSRKLTRTRGPLRVVVQVDEQSSLANVLARLPVEFSSQRYVIGHPDGFTVQNLLTADRVEDQFEDKTPASALPKPMHAFELLDIAGGGDDTVAPTTGSSQLYLRFVHRYSFLVPFYCTTPTRQAVCGSPFVCSSPLGALTGEALYRMVLKQFLLGRRYSDKPKSSSNRPYAPTFVLRRVRDDGIGCGQCHWSTGCQGCEILPTATAAELLDLENCETIAIDWDLQLHPQDQSAFWWLQSYPTRDHSSYIHYRRTRTHSLQQSLISLCSTEHLDASCTHCQQECSPHTKQLSLWSLPPILALQLKRFELSITTGNYQWKKLSHNVDFPVYGLDLHDLLASIDGAHNDSEVCSDRCSVDALDPRVCRGIEYLQNELNIPLTSASRTCAKYDLYAVVHHSGPGIGSGHYTAQFRRPDENYWWNADDAVVTPLNEDDISPSSAAYLLFYVRQDVAAGVTGLSDLFPPQM